VHSIFTIYIFLDSSYYQFDQRPSTEPQPPPKDIRIRQLHEYEWHKQAINR
jgi:hypothetical protein